MGHKITSQGIEVDDNKIKAIQNMQRPTNIKSLKSFLGMINYLSKFLPNLTNDTKIFRDLEKKHSAWHWDLNHDKQFEIIK